MLGVLIIILKWVSILFLVLIECSITFMLDASMEISLVVYVTGFIWFCLSLTEKSFLGFALTSVGWMQIFKEMRAGKKIERHVWSSRNISIRSIISITFIISFIAAILLLSDNIGQEEKLKLVPIVFGVFFGNFSGFLFLIMGKNSK